MTTEKTGPFSRHNNGVPATGRQAEAPGVRELSGTLYRVVYPQGRPIHFLRVIKEDPESYVVGVISTLKRQGEVLAKCSISEGSNGCLNFTVGINDPGHLDLCEFLAEKGMVGRFRDWMEAYRDDIEWDDYRWYPGIGFELAPTAITLDQWEITFPTSGRQE